MTLFLKSWWSKQYNLPLKHPLLQSYNVYELIYEYHDKVERVIAREELLEQETDKIEEAEEKESLDWVAEEERKDREAATKAKKDTGDEQWMIDQLKKEHGEDFGDDISTDFKG